MSYEYDVAVVGGGPAGCAAALEFSRSASLRVVLFEKAVFPRQKACAGGISGVAQRILTEMGIWRSVRAEAWPISAARLVTPSGSELVLAGKSSAAVVNRAVFDHMLLQAAEDAGVEVFTETQVTAIRGVNGSHRHEGEGQCPGVVLRAAGRETRVRYAVVAGGAGCGLRRPDPHTVHIATCTAWFRDLEFEPNRLEMVFDRELTPHYGWLFPETATGGNIGICVYTDRLKQQDITVTELFDRFLTRQYGFGIDDPRLVHGPLVHPILYSTDIGGGGYAGTLPVGDTARLVNAFTGEGISFALESGRIAARVITEGLESNAGTREIERTYARLIRRSMGGRLRLGRLLCRLGPAVLDAAGTVAAFPPVTGLLTSLLSKS